MHRVKVKVVEDALDANETIARANRDDFDRAGVTVVNFMGAPGPGRPRCWSACCPGCGRACWRATWRGRLDADRLASLHVPVVQLQTSQGFGGECHLDANMVRSALPSLPLDEIELLVIENVGNLVCPAEFRVGEDARVMVSSVTEGADKPLKYPLMFRACELVLLNKIDLLPYVDFDVEKFLAPARHRASWRAVPAGEREDRRGDGGVARVAGAAARSAHDRGVAGAEFFAAHAERLGAALRRDGGAVPGRRPAARAGRVGSGALGRPPRRRRVRPPGDRRQAGAARAGASEDLIGGRARRRRDRVRRRRLGRALARLPDDRGVRAADGRPVHPPGADRDALPRAVGARARVHRAPRAARPRRGGVLVPVSVPRARASSRWRAWSRTSGGRSSPRRRRSAALREQTLSENAAVLAAAADALRARRRGCWRSATAARRPTRWTSSPTCGRAGGGRWT